MAAILVPGVLWLVLQWRLHTTPDNIENNTPARCGVIAHEIGHELMHLTNREGTTRQQRELEAESVSYAVLAQLK